MVQCKACRLPHSPMLRCEIARRRAVIAQASSQIIHPVPFVPELPAKRQRVADSVVVHADGGSRDGGSRVVHATPVVPKLLLDNILANAPKKHGKHLNTEARKAYRRKWAQADRAKKARAK